MVEFDQMMSYTEEEEKKRNLVKKYFNFSSDPFASLKNSTHTSSVQTQQKNPKTSQKTQKSNVLKDMPPDMKKALEKTLKEAPPGTVITIRRYPELERQLKDSEKYYEFVNSGKMDKAAKEVVKQKTTDLIFSKPKRQAKQEPITSETEDKQFGTGLVNEYKKVEVKAPDTSSFDPSLALRQNIHQELNRKLAKVKTKSGKNLDTDTLYTYTYAKSTEKFEQENLNKHGKVIGTAKNWFLSDFPLATHRDDELFQETAKETVSKLDVLSDSEKQILGNWLYQEKEQRDTTTTMINLGIEVLSELVGFGLATKLSKSKRLAKLSNKARRLTIFSTSSATGGSVEGYLSTYADAYQYGVDVDQKQAAKNAAIGSVTAGLVGGYMGYLTSKTTNKAIEKTAEGIFYALDPYELPGDLLAEFPKRSLRVPVVTTTNTNVDVSDDAIIQIDIPSTSNVSSETSAKDEGVPYLKLEKKRSLFGKKKIKVTPVFTETTVSVDDFTNTVNEVLTNTTTNNNINQQTKVQTKTESKSNTKTQTDTLTQTDTVTEVLTVTDTVASTQTKVDVITQTDTKTDTQTKSSTDTITDTIQTFTNSTTDVLTDTNVQTETQTETNTETQTESKQNTKAKKKVPLLLPFPFLFQKKKDGGFLGIDIFGSKAATVGEKKNKFESIFESLERISKSIDSALSNIFIMEDHTAKKPKTQNKATQFVKSKSRNPFDINFEFPEIKFPEIRF